MESAYENYLRAFAIARTGGTITNNDFFSGMSAINGRPVDDQRCAAIALGAAQGRNANQARPLTKQDLDTEVATLIGPR